ncbi:MAG: ribosomal RNA small subunit methyltransferase A [Nitrospinaceae bacterium]|nr:ribosomal RNA small subunit methyltransferase A [Nitrospinaceae bacterium]NIR57891.1 ribosomal RNA small subunit methyltransferase A [Nitrospinaceae bacterium]NIS88349.1 ribosomal RNA small subunit methyltransferase A [Nitrospinaceae bacterium]NIT85227.1 ribosomal RNA small subunit methyltransferase A [Nitrospinaceae bacterium]NIU47380.1 ribosomal RNA small subunit methyltransferase A [Nitrospinaceae bacterium]
MRKKQPLGQNFLIDPSIAREIAEQAGISPDSRVIEVGPGKGILTRELLERAGFLLALEIDPKLIGPLNRQFQGNPKFELVQADAMTYDYSAAGPRFQVVSNLPYYAAMAIVKRLIHYKQHVVDMTLMLQKEVADRLAARPGTRAYGSLSVFTQFNCRVERLLEVGKQSFSPPPKVDSSVIRLTPLAQPPVAVDDLKTFHHVVNTAFFHKRKMLRNNLKGLNKPYHMDIQKIEAAGIRLDRRGETLSLQEFATLANLIETRND